MLFTAVSIIGSLCTLLGGDSSRLKKEDFKELIGKVKNEEGHTQCIQVSDSQDSDSYPRPSIFHPPNISPNQTVKISEISLNLEELKHQGNKTIINLN